MSHTTTMNINILSDDEDERDTEISVGSPLLKKHKPGIDSVLITDDESTPGKPVSRSTHTPILVVETPTPNASRHDSSISNRGDSSKISSKNVRKQPDYGVGKHCDYPAQLPIYIPETPVSELPRAEASFVKSSMNEDIFHSQGGSLSRDQLLSGITRMPCLDSINENERCTHRGADNIGCSNSPVPVNSEADISDVQNPRSKKKNRKNQGAADMAKCRKQLTEGERINIMIEKGQKKEQQRMQKAALKAEAEAAKRIEKEKKKWEKGKFALKSILAEIDSKVVESGSVGGHLLTCFSEKGLKYHITSKFIEGTVFWTMTVPKEISQVSSEKVEIPYVVLVYMAEEFCNIVRTNSFMDNVSNIRRRYPSYTICILTSNLTAYINKREQAQYKNPSTSHGWTCPPVEEVFAKLTTDFSKVHSRHCMDEAELAEHLVGLTCSLASCQFRKKPTRLSVNANGMIISKDSIDKNLIKKSLWLKALVAIPKVQPRCAVAIWKKYPTMKSLFLVYMDSTKSVREKEFVLKDVVTEGVTGEERRVGEMCSKRVYRILMANNGRILTDDVEDGADLFSSLPC